MRRAALVAVIVISVGCSSSSSAPLQEAGPTTLAGNIGAATYQIDVPAGWNGTLFLYSHGYVAPGGANLAIAAPAGDVTSWLLGHHFAIAGSSYSSTGWAIADALKDQMALLDFFGQRVGTPKRVIAWGHSLGGIITAGLVQLYPNRFAAALPMCGVLAGGIATWNLELDGAYAFKTLLAPASLLQLVNISNPAANLQLALDVFGRASATPAGRARLALVAALIDLPGWFDPRSPAPAADDFAAQETAQASWESRVDFAFAFQYRAELEQRAGGNPSWNIGVDYRQQLANSPDRDEVVALYSAAGLDLQSDLQALSAGARLKADPAAASYLDRYISFDGRLRVPVLTMHTTGDGLVVAPEESAYASVVSAAGDGDLLRQVFVRRAGHCAFSPAETIAAVQVLLKRLDSGRWDDAALDPAALSAAALSQGAGMNSFFGFPAPPAFVTFTPAPYPRPFPGGQAIAG